MPNPLVFHVGGERPDKQLWLVDTNGNLIDFSSGYTFEFTLGNRGEDASFTKTTGITGAAGSGSEPDGTPNITLTFTNGELDSLAAGAYTWQVRATTSSLDRFFQGQAQVIGIINTP